MTRTRSLHTLAALVSVALVPAARAAEVTRVLTAADPDNPFDLDFSVTYRHGVSKGKITREAMDPATGQIIDSTEMRYTRTADVPVARLAVGLYHDLELHVELPWVLGDNRAFKYASGVDNANSTIYNGQLDAAGVYHPIDASGVACPGGPGSCPIFQVGQTAYHGKTFADMLVGVAWGILSERRDDTKPTWVVGLDVTLPSGTRWNPSTIPLSYDKSNPAALGERLWKYDVWTALSRQFGPVDPYIRLHVTLPALSGTTYSNCDSAAALVGNLPPQPQMASGAVAGCAAWGDAAGARPPRVLGLEFGTELVAYDNRREGQRVAFDVRVGAEWTSESRWLNELTDATGKLMHTDSFSTLRALGGAYLRASTNWQLRLWADFRWRSDHYLSGEPLGRPGTAAPNPNFDWRYDSVGNRFRISEATVLDLGAAAMFSF